MAHRFAEPVEVSGPVGHPTDFRWRGRSYEITALLTQWLEFVPWWHGGAESVRAASADDTVWWRVEARAKGERSTGTYDLVCLDAADPPRWQLAQVLD